MENDVISLDAALKIYGGADDNKKAKIIIEDQNNEKLTLYNAYHMYIVSRRLNWNKKMALNGA